MGIACDGISIGAIATVAMDVWAAIAKHILHLPTSDWALVGRWLGYMSRGAVRHRPISASAPLRNERITGWIGHYLTGAAYGVVYLYVVQVGLDRAPSLLSALTFGLVTLFAPWLVMQPAMGAGVFASLTPQPSLTRMVNVSMHSVFGVSLYLGWLLVQ